MENSVQFRELMDDTNNLLFEIEKYKSKWHDKRRIVEYEEMQSRLSATEKAEFEKVSERFDSSMRDFLGI